MGACLMMRKVELFDDRFFLYCEDTELCKRLETHGQIRYVPSAKFFHQLGSSSEGARWKSIALYNRGKELYFQIHHGRFSSFICFCIDRKGALLRLLAWSLASLATLGTKERFRRQAAAFWRVLCAPIDPAKELFARASDCG
jgi:GT2 family glycosyltransferase